MFIGCDLQSLIVQEIFRDGLKAMKSNDRAVVCTEILLMAVSTVGKLMADSDKRMSHT